MRRVSIFCFAVLALTAAFWNSPAQAVEDWFWVSVDSTGMVDPDPMASGGTGYNGGWWYEYYDSGWWNEWFYNAPFDPERKKEMEVDLWIEPLDPDAYVRIVYNWSTDAWYEWATPRGITEPPLPDYFLMYPIDEDVMIDRTVVIYDGLVPVTGMSIYDRIYILDYNPEWVSIDVQGYNFYIDGMIRHECQPVKWKQLPDTTENGIDIKVDDLHWLGDDFECITTGPLTGIHFWVSYFEDNFDDNAIDTIHVEIYSDDPAGLGGSDPDNDYSMPDQKLWDRDFTRAEFMQRLYAVVDPPGEYWWDPATAGGLIPGADYQIYQIDIDISQDDTFTQEGTPDEPRIYWLVIQIRKNPNFTGEIGWKTRKRANMEPHNIDDAVFAVGSELPRIWHELRYPPEHPYYEWGDNSIDLAFVIQSGKWFGPVKWSQPPVLAPDSAPPYEPLYLGWDELSVVTSPLAQPMPFCADDFYCLGPKPVTKIHWWGSFEYWDYEEIPPVDQLPQAFQIGFWTDVPVGTNPDIPYSHPGEMVWEIYCYDYELEFYGWDYNPWTEWYEAKFQFNQDFLPEEWFHQLRENEIYWVSIAADYGDWIEDPFNIWGWETRPHMFQDDAVRIYPVVAPQPGDVLDPYNIEEIQYPDGVSWDLAYELGTDPSYIKWEQRFDPRWPWHEDIWSQARRSAVADEVVFEAIVADDWPCRSPWPVTAVEWWGSYLGYTGEPGTTAPLPPDYFLLTIWTDNPVGPGGYSQPDELVWTYRAYNYVEVPVGKETMHNEAVFMYYVNLPVEDYFFQELDPDLDERIYWISIVAVYPQQVVIPYDWGWTNHEHVFMDDAVVGDPISPVDPWQFDWYELFDWMGDSADMSFVLETEPICFTVDKASNPANYAAEYAQWVTQGKPKHWCCPHHAEGDANGDGKITSSDYLILRLAFGAAFGDGSGKYDCRADFNHDGRITSSDYLKLRLNFGKNWTPDGVCPPQWKNDCGYGSDPPP